MVSIYCAVGQRSDSVARVVATLRRAGAMRRTVVVVAGGEQPVGLRFVAPYTAMTIAEWFMDRGEDVLIVFDDLTRHARAHRELSLLLRRPPGREAYPGDVFHLHARLLERAAQLGAGRGGGSVTALPIVETQAENLSAYVPTNLISITDGQIYLSPRAFRSGQLPAVDLGRSVSRVGGDAQPAAYRRLSGSLRLAHARFEELERFARFGARLEPAGRRDLERGRRVRRALRQRSGEHRGAAAQLAILTAVTGGLLDDVPIGEVDELIEQLAHRSGELVGLVGAVVDGRPLDDSDLDGLARLVRDLR
jgi:F-type H+-transporting ATPase subunit alpha